MGRNGNDAWGCLSGIFGILLVVSWIYEGCRRVGCVPDPDQVHSDGLPRTGWANHPGRDYLYVRDIDCWDSWLGCDMICRLYNGTKLDIVSKDYKGWDEEKTYFRIINPGCEGWVKTEAVSFEPVPQHVIEERRIDRAVVNIRAGPGTDYEKRMTLRRRERIYVVEEKEGWVRFKREPDEMKGLYWVRKDLTTRAEETQRSSGVKGTTYSIDK